MALHDATFFDIRQAEAIANGVWRLTIAHSAEPRPGSLWALSDIDHHWPVWDAFPSEGGRRVAMIPSPAALLRMFNNRYPHASRLAPTPLLTTCPPGARLCGGGGGGGGCGS